VCWHGTVLVGVLGSATGTEGLYSSGALTGRFLYRLVKLFDRCYRPPNVPANWTDRWFSASTGIVYGRANQEL